MGGKIQISLLSYYKKKGNYSGLFTRSVANLTIIKQLTSVKAAR